jgi:hypothetical protein
MSALLGGGSVFPDYSALLGGTLGAPMGDVGSFTSAAGIGGSQAVPLAPGVGGGGGFAAGMGGPLGVAGIGIQGLSSLASLWMGLKAHKLAQKQFKFTKDVTNTNLANQIQSYNTALADRARSRGVMEGQSADQVQGYISANALSRNSGKSGPASTGSISGAALSNYNNYIRPGSASAGSVARDDDTNG